MTRISMFCAISSALAALALSANGASAFTLIERTTAPKISTPSPQTNVGRNITTSRSFKQGVVAPKTGTTKQLPAVQ